MANPKEIWTGMQKNDRYMLLSSIVVPITFWWFYIGRHKYGMKGMK